MSVRTFIFMGRPGAGKGTQARMFAERTGFEIFSTGTRYREIAQQDTFVGRKIKHIIDQGYLTPHWFASYLFAHELLNMPPETGVIFEGAGRTEPEAKLFDEITQWLERPYRVFYLNISEQEVFNRLKKRGRADDDPEDIERRLHAYDEQTAEALAYFRSVGAVIDINGEQTPEQVHESVWEYARTLTD